jgi:hypothetical protein
MLVIHHNQIVHFDTKISKQKQKTKILAIYVPFFSWMNFISFKRQSREQFGQSWWKKVSGK